MDVNARFLTIAHHINNFTISVVNDIILRRYYFQQEEIMKKIQSMRREYGNTELLERDVPPDPFTLFDLWLNQAIDNDIFDASAMVLATVDEKGLPDARVVLLKEYDERGFVFFTHYDSPKAMQAEKSGVVALNFYWRDLTKQIRIKGKIQRVAREESESYFASRPRGSQISTHASKQSSILQNRAELEKKMEQLTANLAGKDVPCPTYWGGYRVVPYEFEFFQGRDNRLNDRIRYCLTGNQWQIERLSP
jgi:pyridoxamine 5'-phosphate oxidase